MDVKGMAALKQQAKKQIASRGYDANGLICISGIGDNAQIVGLLDVSQQYEMNDTISKEGVEYVVIDVLDAELIRKVDQSIELRSEQIEKAKNNYLYIAQRQGEDIEVACLKRDGDGYAVLPKYQDNFGAQRLTLEQVTGPNTLVIGNSDAAIKLNTIRNKLEVTPEITVQDLIASQPTKEQPEEGTSVRLKR